VKGPFVNSTSVGGSIKFKDKFKEQDVPHAAFSNYVHCLMGCHHKTCWEMCILERGSELILMEDQLWGSLDKVV
jgi:hypothetical protein